MAAADLFGNVHGDMGDAVASVGELIVLAAPMMSEEPLGVLQGFMQELAAIATRTCRQLAANGDAPPRGAGRPRKKAKRTREVAEPK
jgi:hypothetical protein